MSSSDHTKHIVQSLVINGVIAVAKFGAAFFTKSGSMLAEAIHSASDCGNQLLLLRGVSESKRPPTPQHPLGYGRSVYFFSFIVALFLFTLGGVFSIYEGVHKILHPEPVEHVGWAIAILAFSLLLEGYATYGNVKSLNESRAKKKQGFFEYLKNTKDSDLVVVFGENSAAVLGLALAIAAIGLTLVTGNPIFDAIGSLLVGVVLVGVALFLGIEVKSLLVGEAADPEIAAAAQDIATIHDRIEKVFSIITMQQGPGEVLVAVKLEIRPTMSGAELIGILNDFEDQLRARCPEIGWLFTEPDTSMGKGKEARLVTAVPPAVTPSAATQ
jgi:cation diffusion facilitator family transporter